MTPLLVFFAPLRVRRRDRQYKAINACEMVDEATIGGLLCAGCSTDTVYRLTGCTALIHPCLLLLQTRQEGRLTGNQKKKKDGQRDRARDIQTSKNSNQASLPAPLPYCADASASESWESGHWFGGADRWLSVSYPEIARKRLSGRTDLSGDVTRRGPIAGFRAWHGIRQEGAMERGLAAGVGGSRGSEGVWCEYRASPVISLAPRPPRDKTAR